MCCAHEVFSDLTFLVFSSILYRVCFYNLVFLCKRDYKSFWCKFHFGSSCLRLVRSMEAVDTSWLALIAIISAHVAERRVRAQIRVFQKMTVTLAIYSQKNNAYSCLRLLIGSRKKRGILRNLIHPNRTHPVPLS